ncbi:phosphoribosylamine--glycine ligase [bacterium]|nr:phosphoribosylamine--glycine ligase [bacterium]
MNILVVGSGAREHAIAWKVAQSPLVKNIFVWPGNAGIFEDAQSINLASSASLEQLVNRAKELDITMTIVGPEQYLADGIVDLFREHKLSVVGVNKAAAALEASKAFAKDIMKEANIPTAGYFTVSDNASGIKILEKMSYPAVLKADGLAAGKGVVIAQSFEEARNALQEMLAGKFNDAGKQVVIEEFLKGEELSLLLFVDGKTATPMLFSQDHKAAYEGDKGPNTGGMGAYTPVSIGTDSLAEKINTVVTYPLLNALKKRDISFRGILYIGVMMVENEPFVLEYNVRFGDPETEPLMMAMKSDIVLWFSAVADGFLEGLPPLEWHSGYTATVVLSSQGYPGSYEKGKVITGLDSLPDGVKVFHAGTTKNEEGELVTAGGRVLMVTAQGTTLKEATTLVYRAIKNIHFDGMQHRKDIGYREIAREQL